MKNWRRNKNQIAFRNFQKFYILFFEPKKTNFTRGNQTERKSKYNSFREDISLKFVNPEEKQKQNAVIRILKPNSKTLQAKEKLNDNGWKQRRKQKNIRNL